jgi:hypothetical protein
MTNVTTAALPATTYANFVNNQYIQTSSNYVTLQTRLNQALQRNPAFKGMLDAAVAEFKRRNPHWNTFSNIKLCKALTTTLDLILIDTTLQRPIIMEHILKILANFKETMIMPIQVYESPEQPDRYMAWDGQHTAIVLYIILTKVFGQTLASAMVPIVVYNVTQKLEIRRNFIELNGDAKEAVDFIEIFKQQVSGVKIDGATDKDWVESATKNDYFANAGLFATHQKYGDHHNDGAFTLLSGTLMHKSAKVRKNPEVTRMFAQYWNYLGEQRPVDAKEARQLYEYFDACFQQNIKVDDTYLLEMAAFTKNYFEADFSEGGMFWSKVRDAYTNWYRNSNSNSTDRDINGNVIIRGFTTEWKCGGPFLIAQIKKSTKLKTPAFIPNNGFQVDKKDLW